MEDTVARGNKTVFFFDTFCKFGSGASNKIMCRAWETDPQLAVPAMSPGGPTRIRRRVRTWCRSTGGVGEAVVPPGQIAVSTHAHAFRTQRWKTSAPRRVLAHLQKSQVASLVKNTASCTPVHDDDTLYKRWLI